MVSDVRVQITEDEAIVAMEIEARLTDLGYIVSGISSTGREAIELAEQERPDVVLMDIMLKGSMNGIEAANIIKDRFDIPIIFLTAYSDSETLKKSKESEPYAYLLKPFTGRELHTSLEIAISRHRMEKKLRESERRYKTFVEGTNDLVQSISSDEKIVFVNSAWLNTLGYPQSETEKMKIEDYVDSKSLEAMKKALQKAFEGNTLTNLEFIFRTNNGSRIYVKGNMFPGMNNGEIVSVHSFFRDVTLQHHTEKALKNAAETAMLYIDLMGHDLRQSLQAISSGLDILEMTQVDESNREFLDIMFQSVKDADELIKKVQKTRGLLQSSLSEVNLKKYLEDGIHAFRHKNREVKVNVNISVESAKIKADEYISFLIRNLLENAVIHSRTKDKSVWISLSESANGYLLSIADNGQGISPEDKISLFDPEKRFGGVGIHQSIRIIQKYGGKLSVSDRIQDDFEKGAKFEIWFPKICE
ncbi:MAG: response regulator [Candidatus Lokiarchaeota archaeon]|nr:response regulator [Candidatus Lokiarchaeota archaeon]